MTKGISKVRYVSSTRIILKIGYGPLACQKRTLSILQTLKSNHSQVRKDDLAEVRKEQESILCTKTCVPASHMQKHNKGWSRSRAVQALQGLPEPEPEPWLQWWWSRPTGILPGHCSPSHCLSPNVNGWEIQSSLYKNKFKKLMKFKYF